MNGGGIIILIKKSSLMKERMVMYEKIWRVIDGSFIGRRGDSIVVQLSRQKSKLFIMN